jgi:hypothetical protein|tara:strand:+ start:273 stop:608 length:336 start_codon:yes stop_codon:yes gene_type:complete
MASGTYNFTVEQGATFTRLLTLQENSSAMNLSGYSAASQMRSTADTSTVAGTFTATISNASNGQITLSMTANQTGAIEEGIYVYDIEITSGAGSITRILQGKVTVTANVTR